MYLFQYPLRPNNRFYGDQAQLTSVILNKNNNSKVKIEYSIESKNQRGIDYQTNENNHHNQILNGDSIGLNTNYCVGSFKDKSLHLNPISQVLQFRPEFIVLDENNQNRKNKERAKDKYAKNTDVRENISKHTDEWINLEYIDQNRKKYFKKEMKNFLLKEKLYADENMDQDGYENLKSNLMNKIEFISREDYYSFLFKNINNENISESYTEALNNKAEKQLPLKEMKEMPLDKKIEYFIRKVNFTSLSFFIQLLKETKPNEKLIFEILSKYVNILKTGHLVLKSEIRYENKSHLIIKRNQIIAILQNNLHSGTEKAEIQSIVNLEKDEINEILNEIGITTLGRWYLKDTKPDHDFINKFTDYYKENIKIWELIIDAIKPSDNKTSKLIEKKPYKEELKISTIKLQNPIISKIIPDYPLNISKKEVKNEIIINNVCPNNLENVDLPANIQSVKKLNSNKFLESQIIKFFEEKGGCIYEASLVDYCQNELQLKKSDFENDLTKFLKDFCYKIGNSYFIKSLNDTSLDPIRQEILEFFLIKESAKKNELQENLKNKSIKFTENTLKKVLKKIAVFNNSKWMVKTPETIND